MDRRTFSAVLGTAVVGTLGSGCTSTPNRSDETNLDQDPPQPVVGTLFEYDHEGPRPFGEGVEDITGLRWFGVYQFERNLWRIDEAFREQPEVRSFYFDEDYSLHREVIFGNGELVIDYAPPRELRYLNLQKDQPKTSTYRQTFRRPESNQALGEATITETVTRRYDERIVTEPGAYLCRSFDIKQDYVMQVEGDEITYSVTLRSYWADQYAWFVSEEAEFSPVLRGRERIRGGYRTRSELKDIKQFDS